MSVQAPECRAVCLQNPPLSQHVVRVIELLIHSFVYLFFIDRLNMGPHPKPLTHLLTRLLTSLSGRY